MIWCLIENIMLYYHPRRKYYNHDKLIDRENKLCSTKFLHNDLEIKCILNPMPILLFRCIRKESRNYEIVPKFHIIHIIFNYLKLSMDQSRLPCINSWNG